LAKEEGASPGYECSCEESVEEENNLVGRDTDESMEEDENGAVLEDNIGDVDTEEEEEGAVTVLKLSNGVMIRVRGPGDTCFTSLRGVRQNIAWCF
jgi:hypothetical protein